MSPPYNLIINFLEIELYYKSIKVKNLDNKKAGLDFVIHTFSAKLLPCIPLKKNFEKLRLIKIN